MAGIGELSAICGLVATAATISKALYDMAGSFKEAKGQIEAFSVDLKVFGRVLDQFDQQSIRLGWETDPDCQPVIDEIVDECNNIFSQLEAFKNDLFSKSKDSQRLRIGFRGRTKWMFSDVELKRLQARTEAMKLNLVMMMVMMIPTIGTKASNPDKRISLIRALEIKNDACLERLENLEDSVQPPMRDNLGDKGSIATYSSVQSIATLHESIRNLSINRPESAAMASMSVESFSTAIEDPENVASTSELVSQVLNEMSDGNNESNIEEKDESQPMPAPLAQFPVRTQSSTSAYRRCSPQVVGLWAKGTRQVFRWRERRFEVLFEVPWIFLAPPENKRGPIYGRPIHNMDGSDESYMISRVMKPDKDAEDKRLLAIDNERAGWLELLGAIQKEEAESRVWENRHRITPRGFTYEHPKYSICHAIQIETKSWDFVPAGIVKPYATTTVSHIVEMAALLGMYWRSFEVARGILTAQGNGYLLTSSMLPGFGITATFSIIGRSGIFGENRVIPNHDIKELVFGFVSNITGQSLEVGSVAGIQRTFSTLGFSRELSELYERRKHRPSLIPVIFELIGMLAETFRIRGSMLKMLPNPTHEKWPGYGSKISWKDAMVEFRTCLARQDSVFAEQVDAVIPVISNQWSRMRPYWEVDDIDLREKIHDSLDKINDHLRDSNNFKTADITDVAESHLASIMNEYDAIEEIASQDSSEVTVKLVNFYFEKIRVMVESDGIDLIAKHKRNAIWLALMFRMICWFLLHDFDKYDVNIVSSELKGSRVPVYIV